MPPLQSNWKPQATFDLSKFGSTDTATPTFKKSKGKNKGWLSSLISEGGGVGGALAGGAAGTAILPGLGTLVGAGLGGFLGATGGRLAENKIRDDEFRLGDALEEGAITGAISAIPFGGVAKAGKGVAAAGKNVAKAGAKEAAETSAGKNILSKLPGAKGAASSATEMEARTLGIGASEDIAGKALSPKRQLALLKWADLNGYKPGKNRNILEWAEKKEADFGKQIDAIVKKIDKPIDSKKSLDLSKKFVDEFNKNGTLRNNPAAIELRDQLATSISEIDTVAKQVAERRNFQKIINFNRKSASPDPLKEQVHDIARKILNKDLDTVKELKKVNADYKNLSDLQEGLARSGKSLSRASRTGGGNTGFLGMLTRGDTATTVKNRFGNATRKLLGEGGQEVPAVTATSAKEAILNPNVGVREAAKQGILGSLFGGAGEQPEADVLSAETGASNIDEATGRPIYGVGDSLGAGPDVLSESTGETDNPFSLESVQPAIIKALAAGDTKTVSLLKELYTTFGKDAEKKAGGPNITKVTAQQYGLAKSGLDSVGEVAKLLQDNPSLVSRTATPGRGLPVIGGYIARGAGTSDYDSIGYNIADTLLRLRTGAQANASEVNNLKTQIMPRAGDTDEVVQRKLVRLQQMFGNVLALADEDTANASADFAAAVGL